MSRKPAAIPLFTDAYLSDTQHLTLEEHGAYLKLMMIAWRMDGCCLPNDDKRLARMLGIGTKKWASLKPSVMVFWTLAEGVWTQGRLTREHNFVEGKRELNKRNVGRRWEKQRAENNDGDGYDRIYEPTYEPPYENDTPLPPPTSLPSVEKYSVEADASTAAGAANGLAVVEPEVPPPKVEPVDLVKMIFDTGSTILTATGLEAKQARSVIGRWRKVFSDSAVMVVLARCQVERPSEPIEWITKALQFEQRQARGNGNGRHDERESARQIAERLAGQFTPSGGGAPLLLPLLGAPGGHDDQRD